jgi:hypothetical protein
MTVTPTTTQLSTFSIIQNIINSGSVVGSKFNIATGNIYQWDPKPKTLKMVFPYIVVRIPQPTNTDLLVMDHSSTLKEFTVEIFMVVEWMAKDNFINYANDLIRQIEINEQTLMDYGYNNAKIDVVNIDSDFIIAEKECVAGLFNLTLSGNVWR